MGSRVIARDIAFRGGGVGVLPGWTVSWARFVWRMRVMIVIRPGRVIVLGFALRRSRGALGYLGGDGRLGG